MIFVVFTAFAVGFALGLVVATGASTLQMKIFAAKLNSVLKRRKEGEGEDAPR